VVCPGDAVLRLPPAGVVRVGGGLRQDGDHLVALKAGVLRQAPRAGALWVAGRQRRYAPAPGDPVVGTVLARRGDNYDVDIGGPAPAQLPTLAFENATRRNRPNLRDGDLVYARVAAADRDLPPELSCVDGAGAAAGFGPLKEGTVVAAGTAGARALLERPAPRALAALGEALEFELAVGVNGRVWVHAASTGTVVTVAAALEACEGRTPAAAAAAVVALLAGAGRQPRPRGGGGGG
jgi:exosome complex component RRP40